MKDQLNRTIQINATPKRIVSLVPSQTELLYDMGLESFILGITKFCVHPVHFRKEKKIVGGTKDVHFDRIKELKPDIILCNKEENTKEMILELERIAPVHISDIYTIENCLELIEMYGNLFAKEETASQIISEITSKYDDFKNFISNTSELKTAYFIWKNPWMVAASDNFINTMLQLNNFKNYFGELTRYPEIELSEVKNETADLVLLSSEPFPFSEKHMDEVGTYFPNAKVLVVDGEMFSWYGTRLLKAFHYFKSLHQGPLKEFFSNSR
ncbi:helical backbone metal receptor [Subsaxibacter sp. CAU 1640]|uniref:ABC transporter substrate-binding protein n=1 Tax=Subsaxibacter sp. CAU 1640 TaxID=2933271 RepID=UPI002005DB2E|nr:helical backbone metal receptor [Subsaxibacter sp. CAU 1640]MCK7591399.1 helical backbone metal receptor [Subsaxibacter sp. CAU 1640]